MDRNNNSYDLEMVESSINIYRDIEHPKLIEEIAITAFVHKLSEIIGIKVGDPLLYEAYVLHEKQQHQLNKE